MKSSILTCIQEAIHSDCEITGKEKESLSEAQTNMSIKIKGKGQYLLYDFEQLKEIFPFFSNNIKNLKTIADYVLISPNKNKVYVFVIELKKGKKSQIKQIEYTKQFMNFVLERIAKASKQSFKWEVRGIGISPVQVKISSPKLYDSDNNAFISGSMLKLQMFKQ